MRTKNPRRARARSFGISKIIDCLFSRARKGRSAARVLERAVRANRFTIDRRLRDYVRIFGPEFSEALRGLKPKDHWLDAGAGLALAQTEFADRRSAKSLPRLTSVSKVLPPGQEVNSSVRVIRGRDFETITVEEIAPTGLITDLIGVLSYTARPDAVLRKYVDVLRMDGHLFVCMPLMASYVIAQGESMTFYDWFRKIEDLECKILRSGRGLVLRKKAEKIRIPKLKLVSAFHDQLVYRLFAESGD